jgi:hypothetical protein
MVAFEKAVKIRKLAVKIASELPWTNTSAGIVKDAAFLEDYILGRARVIKGE